MSINEQRIREFAYHIWESEGKPNGQGERHWAMACKLVQTQAQSGLAAANDNAQQAASTEPIEPISPTQPAQPVPPSDPIQPTDPVQPAQPVQPASPSADIATPKRARTKSVKADNTVLSTISKKAETNGADSKKTAKPKKAKTLENELS
ncbi:MAG: DUF2934 domain-containing protein [Cellvibrio sp.]